ncbi:hypothetical protein EV426DRAFT_684202 [Tirmania nivea]|nr:hypothetical protein EV426DRAFT_684202 [Tirmania nivea]
MSNPDHFSTIILLSLLIPGGLLSLLIILWWFRILDRPRVLRIIRSNRQHHTYPTTTSTSGRTHSRTTTPDTKQRRAKRWSFTRRGNRHGDLESGMAVGGGGEGGGFTGGGLRSKGGEETSGRVPVAVAGGMGKGYGWEEKGGSESTSRNGSSETISTGEDKLAALASEKTGERKGRKERSSSIISAVLASKKKKKKRRKERVVKGLGPATGTGMGGVAKGFSKKPNRHQTGMLLGPGIDTGILKRISTKAVVGTAGMVVDRSNIGKRNRVRGSESQGLDPQNLQNLREVERRYSRGSKRGFGGIGNSGSRGNGLGMAAMIESIRNSGSTAITGTDGRISIRNSGGSGGMSTGGGLRDSINNAGGGDMGMGMINPGSVRNSGVSGGARNSIPALVDPRDPDRYGPWYNGSYPEAGESAAPGQGGPQDLILTIPVPLPDVPQPGEPSASKRTSSNIAAALAAGGSSSRSSNMPVVLASNRASSNIGVPLSSPAAGGQIPSLPPLTFPPMPNPIDQAQRYSDPALLPPIIPAATAGRGRGDSIIRDSTLSREFMFPTAETLPPSPIAPAIPPPCAAPRPVSGIVTPPAAGSARSGYEDDFKGFGKFPVPEKAKVRERDSDESSVD